MGEGVGLTLGQIAAALGATLEGDPSRVVTGVAPLESAGPTHISFLTDPRFGQAARASRAGAFIAPAEVTGLPAPTLHCQFPRLALVDLLALFHPPAAVVPGVHPSAIVAVDAQVAPTASVGALTVVESGALIGPGVRLHPLVYGGAGAGIGEHSLLVAQVGISGSSRLGRRVTLAGQVGVADHVTIGDGVMVGAQSGVHADIAAGEKVLGTPIRPLTQSKRIYLVEGQLPELVRRGGAPRAGPAPGGARPGGPPPPGARGPHRRTPPHATPVDQRSRAP